MALAIVYSRASMGMDAPLVTVEVHLSLGQSRLSMVGLPATAVKESKERVYSAIINSHFEFPMGKITINLAPADLPKEGGRFDLPIALGILAASGQIPLPALAAYEFSGELALSGALRAVRGILPAVLNVQRAGRIYIIPTQNTAEAGLVHSAQVLSAKHLLDVCAHLTGKATLSYCKAAPSATRVASADLLDVKGQLHAKRALEIAAAGKHSLLYIGPPGTGKTMLASRLPSILPPLSTEEALAVATISSISQHGFDPRHWQQIPFRAPHHSSSMAALIGGGRPPHPGEISLAHHGVLFLDELPEFQRNVLEALREPLEAHTVTISRAAAQCVFPAQFQFIAAMNPCPCGYAQSRGHFCRCSPEKIQRYLQKLSGPLLDRIDMQVSVAQVPAELLSAAAQTSSAQILQRVVAARSRQMNRQGKYNTDLTPQEILTFCPLSQAVQQLLTSIMHKYRFSARVYYRLIKLAQTIADIENKAEITAIHLSEALNYRCLDRNSIQANNQ